MVSSDTSFMFNLPGSDRMLPWLHDESDGFRCHDMCSLVAEDQRDSDEVSDDDGDGIRAHSLGRVLLLQLVELGNRAHLVVVLFGLNFDPRQLSERFVDGDLERVGLRGDAQVLHDVAFQ